MPSLGRWMLPGVPFLIWTTHPRAPLRLARRASQRGPFRSLDLHVRVPLLHGGFHPALLIRRSELLHPRQRAAGPLRGVDGVPPPGEREVARVEAVAPLRVERGLLHLGGVRLPLLVLVITQPRGQGFALLILPLQPRREGFTLLILAPQPRGQGLPQAGRGKGVPWPDLRGGGLLCGLPGQPGLVHLAAPAVGDTAGVVLPGGLLGLA